MKFYHKKHNLNFPYLLDSLQLVAKEFNVIRTPEVFVFKRDSLGFLQQVYSGAIDDYPSNQNKVESFYLGEVLSCIKADIPYYTFRIHPEKGCGIEGVTKEDLGCPMISLRNIYKKERSLNDFNLEYYNNYYK